MRPKIKSNSSFFYFCVIIFFPLALSWYSRCDQTGRCYISDSENFKDEQYLTPGMLPSFSDVNIIPITSENDSETSFSVESLTGYSKNGPLNGKRGFECAGGLDECAYSCCSKGYCKSPVYVCKEKRDEVKLIYIITCSIFGGLVLFYWVLYFILGCNYNNYVIKTLKEQQNYGGIVKKEQDQQKNETIEENEEVDEPGMRTQGTISVDSEQDDEENEENEENNMENKNRKIISNIAAKINQYHHKEYNIGQKERERENERESNLIQHSREKKESHRDSFENEIVSEHEAIPRSMIRIPNFDKKEESYNEPEEEEKDKKTEYKSKDKNKGKVMEIIDDFQEQDIKDI